ncbi:toxin-antitoxin system YwqK family antitoxin [Fusobacterium sp.]|uniref:toxin-antitoxin system YwqK family antitoxin n=1 Tax=Fusobacterium sp. TaxID=68766 RepID=UPI00260D3669|nr:toxin-antitoxin system YwqK family antitoxin [Fusobacterium sp.]
MKKVLIGIIIFGVIGGRTYIYKNRYSFYKYLPNVKNEGQFKNINNKVCLGEGKPFTGRIKNIKGEYTEIYSYKDGELNGLSTVYYNGKVREIGHWKDDRQDGLFQLYNEKGILVDDGLFKDGMRNGVTEQFYEKTGGKRVKGEYRDNLKVGEWEQYYMSGTLQAKANYFDDELSGNYEEYYENGNLKLEGKYKNNLPEGEWKYYSENNTLLNIVRFKNGMFDGVKEDYYPNGVLSRKMEYKDNLPNGKYESYWEDGKLQETGIIKDSEYKEVKFYNKDGKFITEVGKNIPEDAEEEKVNIVDEKQEDIIKKSNKENK